MAVTMDFKVQGMTCSHCVNAVRSEVGLVPGVSAVEVDLTTGRVQVTSESPVDPDVVRAAVQEAGYDLAP